MRENSIQLELVLLRHGLTQWNVERRYLGITDLPLLPEELSRLAALRQQPELGGAFWRVYCSDLRRCRETLALMTPHLKRQAVYDSRLREMDFGSWEGCTYEQLKGNSLYRRWIDDPSKVTPPEGETWKQFQERMRSFLSDLGRAAEDEPASKSGTLLNRRVLLVTHGGIIRNLLSQTVPGVTFYSAAAPPPGTVTVLKLFWQNGQWSADRTGNGRGNQA